nr:hypothetical protein CFP56_74652 [Quercus suber]
MEIRFDIVDFDEFNLPSPDRMIELQLRCQEKFCKSPPILLKWIEVKSPSLSWVKLMDREADFIWRPYVSIADGFWLALLDEDVEFDAPLLALLPENLGVGVLTRRACQYWNEIVVRFNDYAVTAWVAYIDEVPKPWTKYEPMAKARVFDPSTRGKALNAKPPAKRERLETSVDAFALPPPLLKKVRSLVVVGLRVLPRTVLALCAMKDDALAPLNCAVTMCPLPGPEASDNQGTLDVSKGVDVVGEATNMKLVIAKASVQVTLGMGVEAPINATVVPDSQIEPMSSRLDSLTLISNEEHIKAFLDSLNKT